LRGGRIGGREACAETGLNARQLLYDIVKLIGNQALSALEFADELAASAEGMTALLIDRLAQNLKTILGALPSNSRNKGLFEYIYA